MFNAMTCYVYRHGLLCLTPWFAMFECHDLLCLTPWFAVFKCHGLLCVMFYATDCHGERHDLLCLPPLFIKLNVLVCYVLHHGLLS
mgnify:FL=1